MADHDQSVSGEHAIESLDGPSGFSPLEPPVEPLPRHIAFIMDGNGRWASRRGFRRLRGHRQGAESLRQVTRYCSRIGVEEITFYALSTENYRRRPRAEIAYLMRLLRDFLIKERGELAEGNIRLRAIGRLHELPDKVQEGLRESIRQTSSHTGMILRLSLNYGGRSEIIDAIRRLLRDVQEGRRSPVAPESFDESDLRPYFYDPSMPDPDLVVRTAGETRLSNFLLWHASYAEIWITEALWPDFDVSRLNEALRFYARRDRKFGGLDAVVDPAMSVPAVPVADVAAADTMTESRTNEEK